VIHWLNSSRVSHHSVAKNKPVFCSLKNFLDTWLQAFPAVNHAAGRTDHVVHQLPIGNVLRDMLGATTAREFNVPLQRLQDSPERLKPHIHPDADDLHVL
jgi:hypothetical protein